MGTVAVIFTDTDGELGWEMEDGRGRLEVTMGLLMTVVFIK